jgi:CRP/FNR family transcriptional regulator
VERSDFCSLISSGVISPALLRSLPLFGGLNPVALRVLAAGAIELKYPTDKVLFNAGDRPHGLLVILSGRVRVLRARDGRQHLVHEEGAGGTLGDIPMFSGGTYPATAVAAEPTVCLLLPAEAMRATMRSDPGLAFSLLERLAVRTRGLVDRLDRLAGQDVKGRLAALLLERHRAAGQTAEFSIGPQAQLAEELGTVREVLVRALRELRNERVIEGVTGRRGHYRIQDYQTLRRLAE